MEYVTNAPKGRDLLNEHGPADWPFRVDLATFQISSISDCVLTQVFGSYLHGLRRLGLDAGHPHGFDVRPAHNEQYEALQAEWTAIIEEERAKRNGLFGEVHHPAFREVRGDA
jgi:hypothetical protein